MYEQQHDCVCVCIQVFYFVCVCMGGKHVSREVCEQKMNSVYGLVLGECVYDF